MHDYDYDRLETFLAWYFIIASGLVVTGALMIGAGLAFGIWSAGR